MGSWIDQELAGRSFSNQRLGKRFQAINGMELISCDRLLCKMRWFTQGI